MRSLIIFFLLINQLFSYDLALLAKKVGQITYVDIENNSSKITTSITIDKGWSLVNLPVYEIIRDRSKLGDFSAIWSYDGEWYKPRFPKAAYPFWIYKDSQSKVYLKGRPYEYDLTSLNKGWNLIGKSKALKSDELNLYSDLYYV